MKLPESCSVLAAITLLCGCGSSEPVDAPTGPLQDLTVVVLVVDSLMPDEITAATPNLAALKAGGTFYPQSRSVYAAETIPNHVAMMTGVYPTRSNVPANDFIDVFAGADTEETRLSIPERLTANTLFTWIRRQCDEVNPGIRTGATLSKTYLFQIFSGDAADPARANDHPGVFNAAPDSFWDPRSSPSYIPSPDEHTPDVPTMTQALAQLPDVDFFFINLGDVDRSAHGGGASARTAALADTDAQVGRLVTALEDSGRWERTVLFVVSDHGMDFSPPGPANAISTQATLDAVGACFTPMLAVASGGTEGVYVLDRALPPDQQQAALRAARACVLGDAACDGLCPGVPAPANAARIAGAWYIADDALDPAGAMPLPSRSRNLGDLTLFASAAGKFAEPQTDPNGAIPGNHGHPVTLHNTFLISGGSPWVKRGQVITPSQPGATPLDRLPEQSENVDVAPTVAWLLGLGLAPAAFPDAATQPQGFDGRILKEAFAQFDASPAAAEPTVCGRYR